MLFDRIQINKIIVELQAIKSAKFRFQLLILPESPAGDNPAPQRDVQLETFLSGRSN
jgi:hypothetical protein